MLNADMFLQSDNKDVLFDGDKREDYLKVLFEGINKDSAFITLEPSDIITEELLESCSRVGTQENMSTVNIGKKQSNHKISNFKDSNFSAENSGKAWIMKSPKTRVFSMA